MMHFPMLLGIVIVKMCTPPYRQVMNDIHIIFSWLYVFEDIKNVW